MKNIFRLAILVFVLGLLFSINTPNFVFGQSYSDSLKINKEVKDLNSEIDDKKERIKKIEQQQEKYSEAIKVKQSEKASLNNQVAILENRIAKAELDIELAEIEIDRAGLEIQKTEVEIKNKNEDIKDEKDDIANVLNLLYKKDKATTLEILLLNESLADFLSEVKYIEDINEDLKDSLEGLKKAKKQLETEKQNLAKEEEELEEKKIILEQNKEKLEYEKENKFYVLDQVHESEKEFQRLLALAKQEQEAAASEIVTLEKQVRAKLSQLEGDKLEFNDAGMIWPVTKNTITSYFHDPDYPFKYIFEHPAVDIRAKHGSTLKAAASGYVAKVKFDGTSSYGYIMIIHGDGLATVYGHVSKVFAEEDEYVVQGQNIGQSGGLPGTPGAGRLTTGPHLHFEVRLNGIPVDPLDYLP